MDRWLCLAGCAALWLGAGAVDVRADAIDGTWCSKDLRSLSIDGPRIVTPGGRELIGDYDRHGFSYLAPQGERDAGARIAMILINDDELHLTIVQGSHYDGSSELEVWRRCDVTSRSPYPAGKETRWLLKS